MLLLSYQGTMSKLFYFIEPTGYNQYIAAAANGSDCAMVFSGFGSKIEETLCKWHNAWPFNKHIELPFKQCWGRKYLSQIPSDCQYVLMAESFRLSYSKSFLRNIRKHLPQVKLCFVFSNPVGDYNLEKVKAMKESYDIIITFAKNDAEKNGIIYCDVLPFKLPDVDNEVDLESDIFYIGKEKGRLNQLLSVYEKAASLGLKCNFYITEVPEEKQKYADDIVYNHPIDYNEVLYHVQRSRCVLELLQDGCNYISIKTVEALHYHKKLLTNNASIINSNIYNKQYVRVINSVDDIDRPFITNDIPDEAFDTSSLVESYDPLITYLDNYFMSNNNI